MKKSFMVTICFLSIFLVACSAQTVSLGDPVFSDKESTTDTEVSIDDDSIVYTDDDSMVITDEDSVVIIDDDIIIIQDDDTVINPDLDEVPDEIGVECEPEQSQKCDANKTHVLECISGQWEATVDCTDPLKMCVEAEDAPYCKDLNCVPGTKTCISEDVYTCSEDGMTGILSKNCTDTQYCDEKADPVDCKDMICVPNENFCETNILKECNEEGSASSTLKECGTGVCDETLENCVYTGEVGGTFSFDRTGQRGNFFDCSKNVKVIEFSQQLEYTGNKDLSWAIYEAEGNSTTYSRIFIKSATTTGTGKAYYSTGTISVNLVSGKKYIFVTAWSGTTKVHYGSNPASSEPIQIGFGSTEAAHSVNSTTFPDTYTNPTKYEVVFNQQIKFVE